MWIGIFTLPASILATGFVEEVHHWREEEDGSIEVEVMVVCPHCGRRIGEPAAVEAIGAGGAEESQIAGAGR